MTVFGGPACVEYGHLLLAMILKDESTREQYDYAIAHPEEVSIHSLAVIKRTVTVLLLTLRHSIKCFLFSIIRN